MRPTAFQYYTRDRRRTTDEYIRIGRTLENRLQKKNKQPVESRKYERIYARRGIASVADRAAPIIADRPNFARPSFAFIIVDPRLLARILSLVVHRAYYLR